MSLGAWRCAQKLTARLGVPVGPAAVQELARQGLIGYAGFYKGYQLYDEGDLDGVTAEAAVAAEPLNRREAARYLGIRYAYFELALRAGLIIPDDVEPGKWGDVRLFTRASLDAFAARPDVDLPAVRAARRGSRTPLHEAAETELVLRALGGPPPPKVKPARDRG